MSLLVKLKMNDAVTRIYGKLCIPGLFLLISVYILFLAGNVLSLRNNLNLSADTTEVSQEKLLSLVAERLIDSNSNTDVIYCNLLS